VYYLFGKKTIDEIVYPLITSKSSVTSKALDNTKSDYTILNKGKEDYTREIIEKGQSEMG